MVFSETSPSAGNVTSSVLINVSFRNLQSGLGRAGKAVTAKSHVNHRCRLLQHVARSRNLDDFGVLGDAVAADAHRVKRDMPCFQTSERFVPLLRSVVDTIGIKTTPERVRRQVLAEQIGGGLESVRFRRMSNDRDRQCAWLLCRNDRS